MSSCPRSVDSSIPGCERPVVSGLGISLGQRSQRLTLRRRCAKPRASKPGHVCDWCQEAPPSNKTTWKRRHDVGQLEVSSASRPAPLARKEVDPEMWDKCFGCLDKGHYRSDYTNYVLCFVAPCLAMRPRTTRGRDAHHRKTSCSTRQLRRWSRDRV
ncbi:hypothetical protein ZWY2020_001949 [Hordeum vulgare]|nr:hypothetical protein ZWY2020_001949 [Hordeum vulgare]